MDIKTICENLNNQANQLSNIVSNITSLSYSIQLESNKDAYNIDIIKSYVAAADIQMTAMDSQKFIVQGLLDSLTEFTKSVNIKKVSKATS